VKRVSRWSRSVVAGRWWYHDSSSAFCVLRPTPLSSGLRFSAGLRHRPARGRGARTGGQRPRSSRAFEVLVVNTVSWSSSVWVARPLPRGRSWSRRNPRPGDQRPFHRMMLSWAPVSTSCRRFALAAAVEQSRPCRCADLAGFAASRYPPRSKPDATCRWRCARWFSRSLSDC